jgi:DNA uptake protein ComE-like DNA-binding protein
MPIPPPPPAEPDGTGWAVIPLLTFGLGAPFSFLWAATRTRDWRAPAAGVAYGTAYLTIFFGLFGSGSAASSIALGMMLMLTLWVTTSVHAFTVKRQIYPRKSPRERANDHAIEVARYRRQLREQARALLAEDPGLATELCIGRPDLPRAYDDGGLIDVNHVPAPTLALLPGMTDEIVQRVIRMRTEQGGFVSAEELGIDADLSPDLVQRLSEYAIFTR